MMLPRLIGTARSRSRRASFQSSGSPFALLAAAHKELEMRRRDFAISLVFTAAMHRCGRRGARSRAALRSSSPPGPIAHMSETLPLYQPFFEELRRLGDIEGQNFAVEWYSGEGRPERLAALAREVVDRNPDAIIAISNPVAAEVRAATSIIPIVCIGVEAIQTGLAPSLARPGGNATGITITCLRRRRSRRCWGRTSCMVGNFDELTPIKRNNSFLR
jgi:hypothetical protein